MAVLQDLGELTVTHRSALGDGATDISTYLLAAATAAASSGYVVVIPQGTFICTVNLSAFDNITYVGAGKGSVLKLPSGAASGSAIIQSGSYCNFEGITFDPNSVTNSTCVYISAQEWVSVRGCHFISPRSGGVHIAGACTQISIHHNQFEGAGYGVLTAVASTVQDLSIIGNTFEGASDRGDAIEINTPDTGGSSIVIADNVIRGYTATGTAGFGIGVSGGSKVTIRGNVINNCREGIHFEHGDSATVGSSKGVIEGNIIDTCARSGISVVAGSAKTVSNVIVRGNQLYSCNSSAGTAALAVEGNGTKSNVIVDGNHVEGGTQAGIQVASGSGTVKNCVVANNICRNNTGPGIIVGGASGTNDNILVAGNRCYDDSTSSQTYGLEIRGTQGVLKVYDNDFLDNATAAVLETSVGGTIRYRANEGWVTEAQGTGSIDNGGTTDVITHGLSYTPNRAEISITLGENPTNTPGAVWVDTIGGTNFTVNSENDPGASGLDFSWMVRKL